MASYLDFDEMNVMESEKTKRKAIPYDEYFDEMNISYEQKKERIELAEMLDDVFFYAFTLAETLKDESNKVTKLERLNSALEESLRDTMQEYGIRFDKDAYWGNYASKKAYDIARATVNHENDSFYTSDDRAQIIAENEANSIMNHQEFRDAIEAGYTSKTWVSEGDERVRPTHAEVDGTTLPIGQPFYVGAYTMMYPRDDSLGASEYEIANCRCSIEYGNEFEKNIDIDGVGAGKIENEKSAYTMAKLVDRIDMNNLDGYIEGVKEGIRHELKENMIIIRPNGEVYHAIGNSQGVIPINGSSLYADSIIIHNHPTSNGIVSFGADDFKLLKNNPTVKKLIAVNDEYDYSVIALKQLDISYKEYYTKADNRYSLFDKATREDIDVQHDTMIDLKRAGYVKYERIRIR